MFAEKIKSLTTENEFGHFAYQFVRLIENGGWFGSKIELISVVKNRDHLKKFTDGLDESETKTKLQNILSYDETYYERLTAFLVPMLQKIT